MKRLCTLIPEAGPQAGEAEMADTVQTWSPALQAPRCNRRQCAACKLFLRRRSTIAFLMCLPLILIITCLVIYPAFYSIYLSMLNKAQTRFIGLGNFSFLLSRDVFWMVVQQTAIFALSRGVLQSADRADHRTSDQQSAGQGSAQMARHAAGAVGHPAGAVVARLVVAVRSDPLRLQLRARQPRVRRNPVAERAHTGRAFR